MYRTRQNVKEIIRQKRIRIIVAYQLNLFFNINNNVYRKRAYR